VEGGATGGRAVFDIVGTTRNGFSSAVGPNNVKGGNLGERLGEMGALKREASAHRPNTYDPSLGHEFITSPSTTARSSGRSCRRDKAPQRTTTLLRAV